MLLTFSSLCSTVISLNLTTLSKHHFKGLISPMLNISIITIWISYVLQVLPNSEFQYLRMSRIVYTNMDFLTISIIKEYNILQLFIENGIYNNVVYEHLINRQYSENMIFYNQTL